MTTPLEAAIRAGCDCGSACDYPDCLKVRTGCGAECRTYARQAAKAFRAFINDPHLSISYECRETLRAHLGEG